MKVRSYCRDIVEFLNSLVLFFYICEFMFFLVGYVVRDWIYKYIKRMVWLFMIIEFRCVISVAIRFGS